MSQQQEVRLEDLTVPQLQEVKRQLDEEIEHLAQSFTSLKQAQAKYKSCLADINEVKAATNGKQILVPLTASLYVPGKIRDPENVIIDIGTGYYVKKSRKQALTHYSSKITFVQTNLDKLQESIERKQGNMAGLREVLEAKMVRERQQQASAGQAS